MVSFIIISKDKKKRIAYSKEYAAKQNVDKFDITLIEKDSESTSQSIGIESVKLIQKKLFFKPIKSPIKILIIEDAHLLTPEAQNALLKVLEEPPANTEIILGTDSKEALLSTILSRCQIIELEEEQKIISEKIMEEMDTFISNFATFSLGDRLKQAEQLAKDKDKAIVWIENLILVMRQQVLVNYARETFPNPRGSIELIRSFQKLLIILKTTNVNPRFAIENTLLSL